MVVSVVHVCKSEQSQAPYKLDGRQVEHNYSILISRWAERGVQRLSANRKDQSFQWQLHAWS